MFFIQLSEFIPLAISIFVLLGTIILTIKTNFIQFRTIPQMFKFFLNKNLKNKTDGKNLETIEARKALFTAMSTSIGIGNIVAPIIAIKLGGPGALLGFILVTLFGGAATFAEVTFALKFRKKNPDGTISGGPMQYLKEVLPSILVLTYACATFVTLIVWSGNQSNALADLLEPYNIPKYLTGILLAIAISYILIGGIKRVGNLSAKLVPLMFILYSGSTLWIILRNAYKLPEVFYLIFKSAFTPQALIGGTVGYGIQSAFRWGLAKGFFTNESGLGMASIPHSMAETHSPVNQGILSIIAVYTNGFLCLLSGLTVLVTETWKDPDLGIGINILVKSFRMYFPSIGIFILIFSAFLFALGTIVGNSYNGGQCFLYVTKNRWLNNYNILIALIIFWGAISNVEALARITDFFLVPVAIPNIIGIVMLAFKRSDILKTSKNQSYLSK